MGLTKTYIDGSTPDIAIIGAGYDGHLSCSATQLIYSGLCVGIQLQRLLQLTSYKIFEVECDIGGTWLQNSYPGCACDNLSHLYNYSFAPNYDWSRRYVPQEEILEYLRSTARMYNIYDRVQFRSKVTKMQWYKDRKKWKLNWTNLETGEEMVHEADIVIHAAGLFKIPRIPQEFAGFHGEMWHSARWRADIDLKDKRVGIVGSGASAIQIVPEIVDKVKTLQVYGRSPSYILPLIDAPYSETWKTLFRRLPFFHTLYTTIWHYILDSLFLVYWTTWYSSLHRAFFYLVIWWHRWRQVPDPRLRKQLTPTRLLGSKRAVLSNTYYNAIAQSNVEYHSHDIIKVEGNKIFTADNKMQQVDILILATGFETTSNFPPGYWIGRDGTDVAVSWASSPKTYYGVCAPGAPNFFMAWGPLSGAFHQPLTSMLEHQVMFMIKALSLMMKDGYSTIEITEKATSDYVTMTTRKGKLGVPYDSIRARVPLHKKLSTSPSKHSGTGLGASYWCGPITEFNYWLSRFHPELFKCEHMQLAQHEEA
ncbi:hypothetical protein BGX28_001398 [Mortierella sp. GBA30]|nr:hypothetical protein BGX28_001398 [Mortierella sp. GBA30]